MTPPRPAFAHASEAELAHILDFYDVAWRYEPDTYPILFDRAGNVLESFAPDFYLPELDLYVELTTLKQRLVRKKNRKLRRLRELYPSVRIKLLYARDFRALMLKYGRLALADALSGADGQTTPPREPAVARDGASDSAPLAVESEALAAAPPATPVHAAPSFAEEPPEPAPLPGQPPRPAAPRPAGRGDIGAVARRARRARRTRFEARARAAARAAAASAPAYEQPS